MTDSPLTRVLRAHPYRGVDACDCGNGLHWRALCACGAPDTWRDTLDAVYQDWVAHVAALVAAETHPQYTTTNIDEILRLTR